MKIQQLKEKNLTTISALAAILIANGSQLGTATLEATNAGRAYLYDFASP